MRTMILALVLSTAFASAAFAAGNPAPTCAAGGGGGGGGGGGSTHHGLYLHNSQLPHMNRNLHVACGQTQSAKTQATGAHALSHLNHVAGHRG